jgi:probable rRNA maturation factor
MILNRQRAVRVETRPLKNFLARVRRELKLGRADATICFVSDTEIARMNQAFRNKKGPTDVLSFPAVHSGAPVSQPWRRRSARAKQPQNATTLGDIAISPSTARRNAKKVGHTVPEELRILILHGVLHLLGYDHETDRGQMDRLEARLQRKLGLT